MNSNYYHQVYRVESNLIGWTLITRDARDKISLADAQKNGLYIRKYDSSLKRLSYIPVTEIKKRFRKDPILTYTNGKDINGTISLNEAVNSSLYFGPSYKQNEENERKAAEMDKKQQEMDKKQQEIDKEQQEMQQNYENQQKKKKYEEQQRKSEENLRAQKKAQQDEFIKQIDYSPADYAAPAPALAPAPAPAVNTLAQLSPSDAEAKAAAARDEAESAWEQYKMNHPDDNMNSEFFKYMYLNHGGKRNKLRKTKRRNSRSKRRNSRSKRRKTLMNKSKK